MRETGYHRNKLRGTLPGSFDQKVKNHSITFRYCNLLSQLFPLMIITQETPLQVVRNSFPLKKPQRFRWGFPFHFYNYYIVENQ